MPNLLRGSHLEPLYITQLFFSLHISCRNQAELYFLTNEMTIYLDMFSSVMEYWIRSNMKGSLVVTPECCWDWCLNANFHQELMKPHNLTYRLCHRSIFRLCTRSRDNTLYLPLPSDYISSNKHTVPRNGLLVLLKSCSISICETLKSIMPMIIV